MMADPGQDQQGEVKLGLLLRVRSRAISNHLREAVAENPVRVAATVLLMGVVWLGLYGLFWAVFKQFRRTPLEATVAIPLILNFFFVAIMVMLTFSNGIIAYGALFSQRESAYLMTSPLTALDVVTLKYLETLLVSSWSLVLLGIPLMLVMARQAEDPLFYLLFPAFFLAFIPIPGALGLMLAWGAARFLPRMVARRASMVGGGFMLLVGLWAIQSLSLVDAASETWLRSFLTKMSFVEWAFLPNYWVATGIDHAVARHTSEAFLYLGVTAANALFLSWVAVRTVARYFDKAYDRASAGRGGGARETSEASGGFPGFVFRYLPLPLRLIAAKDLRTFFRDPLQWSQLVILFGLLALYLINMPTWRLQFGGGGQVLIMPFLNLSAISLIVATFTCRFVFPLVSLEGSKLWLIRLLPMPIRKILLAKFAFAMTVTLLVAVGAMGLAAYRLQLSAAWAAIHLGVTATTCFGLCGFAVGIGARMPMFGESNAARIANGLGGTTNLLASVAMVACILLAVGAATWRSRNLPSEASPDDIALLLCLAGMLAGLGAGSLALWWGGKHFDKIEV